MRSVKILEGEARKREIPLPTQKIIHDVGRGFQTMVQVEGRGRRILVQKRRWGNREAYAVCEKILRWAGTLCCVCMCVMLCTAGV
jgi:hypothetical protein